MMPHVRIRYRTPQQLGVLERFHAVLKQEEVYRNLYAISVRVRGLRTTLEPND